MKGRPAGMSNYGLMPLEEVAERLGWSLPTVRTLWWRGIKKLRKEPKTETWINALLREWRKDSRTVWD